jgi:hypothetical protein
VEQRKQARGRHQHFIGSWARLNCEDMPVIPAWIVRSNLNNPRRIPYLLVWKDERHDGKIIEAVRLAHFIACGREANHCVELKRTDESTTILRIVWQMPRNGGRALFLLCPQCETPPPSLLWLGVGQRFGMVEQSQEYQLAMSNGLRRPENYTFHTTLPFLRWGAVRPRLARRFSFLRACPGRCGCICRARDIWGR